MICILIPSKKEAQEFLAKTQIVSKEKYNSIDIYKFLKPCKGELAIVGIGAEKASQNTKLLLNNRKYNFIILAGAAGGLNEELKVGELILANRLVQKNGNEIYIEDKYFDVLKNEKNHVGSILSVENEVCSLKEKQELRKNTSTDCVDLESFAVAGEIKNTPFIVFRVLSDLSNESAKEDFFKNLPIISQKIFEALHLLLNSFS